MRDTVTAPGLSTWRGLGVRGGGRHNRGGRGGHSGRATGGRRGRRIQRDSSLGLGLRVVARAGDFKPAARGPSNAGRSLFDGVAICVHVRRDVLSRTLPTDNPPVCVVSAGQFPRMWSGLIQPLVQVELAKGQTARRRLNYLTAAAFGNPTS